MELKSNVNEKQHNSTPLEMALKHDVMDQTLFGFPTGPPSYNNQREKKYNTIKLLINAKACLDNCVMNFFIFKEQNYSDNDDHRILQLLLDSNASLDHIINQLSTTLGTTPLHLAAKLNETQPYFPVRNPTLAQLRETQYVRILLQAKSNVNLQNDYDNNALWERCEQIFNCQNSTGVDDIVKLCDRCQIRTKLRKRWKFQST